MKKNLRIWFTVNHFYLFILGDIIIVIVLEHILEGIDVEDDRIEAISSRGI